jgi:predicted PurR-regulated permease PerM
MRGTSAISPGNVSTRAAKAGGALVAGSFESVMTFLITIFLVYFFLKDGRVIERALLDLIPLPSRGGRGSSGAFRRWSVDVRGSCSARW